MATILHITDTHLWADKNKPLASSVIPYASLNAVLDVAAKHFADSSTNFEQGNRGKNYPDVILLTGDLTNDDSEEAYRHLGTLLCAKFDKTRSKICFVEGNHANLELAEKVLVKEFGFIAARSPANRNNSNNSNSSIKQPTGPLVVDVDEHWQIVLVNTHTRNEFDEAQVHGTIVEEDLQWLEQEFSVTESAAAAKSRRDREEEQEREEREQVEICDDRRVRHNKKKHTILAIHHPPLHPGITDRSGEQNSWTDECLREPSRRRMRELLWGLQDLQLRKPQQIRLVLHGHLHMDLMMPCPPPLAEQQQEKQQDALWLPPMPTNPVGAKRRGPIQLCGPATCHQHAGLSWHEKPVIEHGCRVLEVFEDGKWNEQALYSETKHFVA